MPVSPARRVPHRSRGASYDRAAQTDVSGRCISGRRIAMAATDGGLTLRALVEVV